MKIIWNFKLFNATKAKYSSKKNIFSEKGKFWRQKSQKTNERVERKKPERKTKWVLVQQLALDPDQMPVDDKLRTLVGVEENSTKHQQ